MIRHLLGNVGEFCWPFYLIGFPVDCGLFIILCSCFCCFSEKKYLHQKWMKLLKRCCHKRNVFGPIKNKRKEGQMLRLFITLPFCHLTNFVRETGLAISTPSCLRYHHRFCTSDYRLANCQFVLGYMKNERIIQTEDDHRIRIDCSECLSELLHQWFN